MRRNCQNYRCGSYTACKCHLARWPGYRNFGFIAQISKNSKSNSLQYGNPEFSSVNFQEEKKDKTKQKLKTKTKYQFLFSNLTSQFTTCFEYPMKAMCSFSREIHTHNTHNCKSVQSPSIPTVNSNLRTSLLKEYVIQIVY